MTLFFFFLLITPFTSINYFLNRSTNQLINQPDSTVDKLLIAKIGTEWRQTSNIWVHKICLQQSVKLLCTFLKSNKSVFFFFFSAPSIFTGNQNVSQLITTMESIVWSLVRCRSEKKKIVKKRQTVCSSKKIFLFFWFYSYWLTNNNNNKKSWCFFVSIYKRSVMFTYAHFFFLFYSF